MRVGNADLCALMLTVLFLLNEVGVNKNKVAMELQKELVRYDVPGHCQDTRYTKLSIIGSVAGSVRILTAYLSA